MIMSPFSSSSASLSTVPCVGAPAGTMIHTIRGASSFFTRLASELRAARARRAGDLLDGVLVAVEGDDVVVGVALDARDHVAAHAAESDESDLAAQPEHLLDSRGEPPHRLGEVVAFEPQVLGAAPAAAQRLQVAGGLGVLQRPEAERPARDRDVLRTVVDEHEEAPRGRPALVQLAGRVQVARPVAERRRRVRRVADRGAQLGDGGVDRLARREEAQQREVDPARLAGGRPRVGEQRAQRVVVGLLGRGQLAALGDRGEDPAGRVLGDLDVGLVERVDPQRPAGDGRRELGEEEDPPEVLRPAGRQRDRRLVVGRERLDGVVERLAGILVVAQVGEDAVAPVVLRRADRLVGHRHDALALLAERLRHELLRPEAERRDRAGRRRA